MDLETWLLFGIFGVLLALSIRMNDKINRMINLLRNNKEPNNESIEDTLIDLANYSVMALIVKRGKWSK